ncbi:hypothetical protein PsalMR5_03773 [Piscirickettsia salmonis]|uniref:hypothetical protein n=1 Tax=Piscirickettsia salmonis TaxID=1238 RepID=UPI0018AC9EB9|nr:hypothetical protein [Piscirickettsia salmonis]QGP56290.1 hypothetical protein PsalSR1_03768 [Piscirickettsia salmonis]QGP57839.1 hypothetical protein PsalBI1_00384 [Piscirickettsia salmonis]QGP65859.1 hypothetical protein PsalMR5_03773 [Piscirickettsia salmonis]
MDIRRWQLEVKQGKKTAIICFEANNDRRDILRVARAIARLRGINLNEVEYQIYPDHAN